MNDLTVTYQYGQAVREGWARRQVAAAGKSWSTHMAKFGGAVLPREVRLISRVVVAPADQDDVYRAGLPTDWNAYRKCSQVCRAEIGEPCFSLSGRVVSGQPDNVRTYLDIPHVARKRRVERPKKK